MGYDRSDPDDWTKFSSSTAGKSTSAIFSRGSTTRTIHPDLNPKTIAVRESCDSPSNPNSTPVIVGLDVTGSMGHLAHVMASDGLGTLILSIYDRKPIPDPHVLLACVGDVYCDRYPLQVTQFETDIKLADQLTNFYIEGGGGGNPGESYNAVWWFAAMKTKCDAIMKRKRKGYLFTVGDEPPLMQLPATAIRDFLGGGAERDLTTEELFAMVSRDWEVFHLMVEDDGHGGAHARKLWRELLGERAISLTDHTKMSEVIVSTLQVCEGANKDDVIKSWSGDTSLAVASAISGLPTKSDADTGGIVRFS